MTPTEILIALSGIAVVGMAAQWIAWRLRLPSILLLLVAGLLAGPLTGLLDPNLLLGDMLHPLVSLGVAVILFEGGLTLDLRELRQVGRSVLGLCTIGVASTWALATLGAHWIAGLPWELALLFGAILTVTGPTVVGPLLRTVRPRGRVGPILKWEGLVADVIGATLAVLVMRGVLEPEMHGMGPVLGTLTSLLWTVFVGAAAGFVGALVLGFPLRRHWIPDDLQSPVTLGLVLGVFTGADRLAHESGLLAVTLMGALLVNQRRTPIRHIIEFKENLRVLLISSLFVVLAARVEFAQLFPVDLGAVAFVAFLIVLVRPISVWLASLGSGLARREVAFIAWMAPRGVVAAAVSALFAAQLEQRFPNDASRLASLAILVIIGTVLVYGLTAGPLAQRLGLSDPDPQGCLLAGGGAFALTLARAIQAAGLPVVLMDTNRAHVAQARLDGLTAVWGSVLAEDAAEEVPLGGIGRLLALTPNDEVNALAALHFSELFGRKEVYQLAARVGPGKSETSGALRGRSLFAEDAHFEALEGRVLAGATIKTTTLTSEFDYTAFRALHGARSLPLLQITKGGRLEVFTSDEAPEAEAEGTLVYLLDPPPVGAEAA